MNARPVLLDLYCKAGGAAMGYYRAGFDVVGVDIEPQPHYPFLFIQSDALDYVAAHGHNFEASHASPECQGYSVTAGMPWAYGAARYISTVKAALEAAGKLWVIENVPGAECDMPASITLCGLSFGLKLFRHRLFESNILLLAPSHQTHKGKRVGVGGYVCMSGHGDASPGRIPADHRRVSAWREASGIDWMIRDELTQAVPPAYTEFIGKQLMQAIRS